MNVYIDRWMCSRVRLYARVGAHIKKSERGTRRMTSSGTFVSVRAERVAGGGERPAVEMTEREDLAQVVRGHPQVSVSSAQRECVADGTARCFCAQPTYDVLVCTRVARLACSAAMRASKLVSWAFSAWHMARTWRLRSRRGRPTTRPGAYPVGIMDLRAT
jgi:hypothetical protein